MNVMCLPLTNFPAQGMDADFFFPFLLSSHIALEQKESAFSLFESLSGTSPKS